MHNFADNDNEVYLTLPTEVGLRYLALAPCQLFLSILAGELP
jgi:hypothetical protein